MVRLIPFAAAIQNLRKRTIIFTKLDRTASISSNCRTSKIYRSRDLARCNVVCRYTFKKFPLLSRSFVTGLSTMPSSVSNRSTAPSFKRLPRKVLPLNYALTYEPDWATHTFDGIAVIDVDIKEETAEIVLNCGNLTIQEATYTIEGCRDPPRTSETFVFDVQQEQLRISFSKAVPLGGGQLKIVFKGKVTDDLKGFFRSKYKGPQGEDRFHYLTKFEPTFARSCFPCWDEPSIKATYDITLIVPKHLVAVSNMPVKDDMAHPKNIDKKIVTFERSVKMSTYVMAFAIGEFDYVETRTPDEILCRVYTPVGKKERGKFALDVVTKSLDFYKDYFGIPYPLPKMDLLGVTEFGSGAMENWGLVIFREQNLLMDEKLSSAITKQYVSIVVAHETAHMWFGNLVTMEWWNDLWLNEGFATWIEFHCVNSIYPELEIWNIFMGTYIDTLEKDASATSHPIQATVEDPSQISSIFDAISYGKGAAVIRMLHNYLGDKAFRVGLSHYLNQHLFANAETEHLWAALKEKSGEAVDVIMPTFTEQMGFPVISVKNVEEDDTKKVITMSYKKFCWSEDEDTTDYKWIIPLTVRTQEDPAGVACKSLINSEPNKEFTVTVNSTRGEWIKLNADHVGYYRATYPKQILNSFIPAIKSKQMEPLDRVGILDDLFANTKAGHANSDDLLKFLLAYRNENVYSVWSGILNILHTMHKLLEDTPLREKFQTYAHELLVPTSLILGWDPIENEKSQDSVLRTVVLSRLVNLNHTDTLQEARSRFKQHVRGTKLVSPDCRTAVYRAVASEGESGFDSLVKVYRTTDLLEEKMRILAAFGTIKEKAVIEKALEFGRGDEVNKQDIITIIMSMCDQGKQDVCWEYFKQNWEFFRDNFPTGHFLIRRLVDSVTSGFKTEEKAQEVEKFFEEHQIKGVERTLSQSLESIKVNRGWLERDLGALHEFLNNY